MLHAVIKHLYPTILDSQFSLQDDGEGSYIEAWSYPDPQPTQEQIDTAAPVVAFNSLVAQFDSAIEAHLHSGAVSVGYTNIERACMYSGSPNPFQAESQSFVAWVGNVWAYCYGELQKVQQGTRAMPTVAEIVSELPSRVPPV